MMPSKLPRCKLSAVGSKPQYTESVSDPATFSRTSLVVSCINIPSAFGVMLEMSHDSTTQQLRGRNITCIKPLARRSCITFSEDDSACEGFAAALAAFAALQLRRLARLKCPQSLLSRSLCP